MAKMARGRLDDDRRVERLSMVSSYSTMFSFTIPSDVARGCGDFFFFLTE